MIIELIDDVTVLENVSFIGVPIFGFANWFEILFSDENEPMMLEKSKIKSIRG